MNKLRNKNDKRKFIKTVVVQSISHLLKEAESVFDKNPSRSKRYIDMAWGLVKRNKVKLTPDQKSKFCRKCLIFWKIGDSLRIFFDRKKNAFFYICNNCNYKRRISNR